MLNPRFRPVVWCAAAILGVWVLTFAGYRLAKNRTITAEKIRAYVDSVDLSQLQGNARADALRKLEDMLNHLSMEERQKARLDRLSWKWLAQMSEEEKSEFIESTMPTGFKQMLTAFEQLPDEKRKRAVDDAVRRMKEAQTKTGLTNGPASQGTNVMSEELQAKVRTIGLKTFYSQSSAQTKAELAPVLEELQKVMENGRVLKH
jgi:hypothetical protein